MSILIFRQEATSAVIVTDTLSTTPDGHPYLFQTKAWYVSHLNMAIAMTGIANLGAEWSAHLRDHALARDVAEIDTFATRELRRLWADLTDGYEEAASATIYHFGYEEDNEQLVRYTYRSATGFQSERVSEPGFGVRPPPESFSLVVPEDLDGFVDLATRVREENDNGIASEPVHIGGELHLLLLENGSARMARIHRFDDWPAHWNAMAQRMARENAKSPSDGS